MPHSPSLRAHIFPYGVLLFCFFLPLWPRLASWLAALVFLVWLFQSSWSRLARPVVLLAPALFFWYLIGVFYSDNQMAGWQVLETKLPLLAFPLILIGSPPGRLQTGQWLRAFAAGCFAAVIISLGLAVWTYFDSGTSHFFYSKLGGFLGFHPTYFSMYISMALFAIVWETASWNRRKIALVLFFLFFFFLLSARMQILILFALSAGALWVRAFQKGAFGKAAWTTGAGLVLVLGLLAFLPTTRQRMERLLHSASGPTANVRLQTWDATIHVIRQHPLTGTGTGDFKEALNAVYQEKGYLAPLKENLNAHNQFLQTAGTLGIPASILWALCLAWPIALAWKCKKPLYLWFLLLFLLSNLTESMLQTQRGAMFFGFFNSLLLAELLNTSGRTGCARPPAAN